jgi:hypothetical protein
MKRREWIAIFTAVILFAISHFTAERSEKISKFRPEAFSERGSLYQGTLELISNKPFGIRPGQFMNEIVPYLINKKSPPNEYSYFDQPHSEFLKWTVQYGWIPILLILAVWIFVLQDTFKKFKSQKNKSEMGEAVYFESLLVLGPQLAFQFPFENPASVLVLGFISGLYLSSFEKVKSFASIFLRFPLAVVALFGILNSAAFFSAIYLESHHPFSVEITSLACRYYPLNFKNCYWRDRVLSDSKQVEAFRNNYSLSFKKNPFYCDNMRLLPAYFNAVNDGKRTCEALLIYETLYKEQKHFLTESFTQCRKYSLPFNASDPGVFKENLLYWFDSK